MIKIYRTLTLSLATVGLTVALASCQKKETPPAEDTVSISGGVTELVFPHGDTEPKTISIQSSTDWTVTAANTPASSTPAATAPSAENWFSVTPAAGEAGEHTLTVSLLEEECETDREATVTITAGTASASFKVIQKAPVKATAIRISAAQKRIVAGQTLPLTVTVEPEGAIAGPVTFQTSDEAVATVDAEGTATAVAPGTATLTATMGELTAEYAVEVTETFITDGAGTEYTFEQLAALPAGVVTGAEGTYTVLTDITIDPNDKLSIQGTSALLVNDGIAITVQGELLFEAEEQAEIRPADENAEPKYLYLTENAGGTIRNIKFTRMPIRAFGEQPLTITDCEMTGITQNAPAINLGSPAQTTVSNCRFTDNAYPAIAGGANIASPLVFENNHLEGNSNDCRNRPHINITVGGEGEVRLIGNTIIGPGETTMNGGIAVANLVGIGGPNRVLIEKNRVTGCRYGITTNGVMDVRIIDNELIDNKWDNNPMTGGSGVSLYNTNGGQKVYLSGNLIQGHLWGITSIGSTDKGQGPSLNLGKTSDPESADYNPGGNIFKDNGNNGVNYDLYNNSPLTVYAQGNTWNVATQDEASIETVIFHKKDDDKLGEVIFMPAAEK